MWGVPVVSTVAMPVGSFSVAALAQSTTFWPREDASVQIGFDGDDFTRNLATILAEMRAVMTVSQPAGIIYGVLPNAIDS